MGKALTHTIAVCISSSSDVTMSDGGYPSPKVSFLPGEKGAIESALTLKHNSPDQIVVEAICVGSKVDIVPLRYLLCLGFDRAKVVLAGDLSLKTIVDALASFATESKVNSLFLGDHGVLQSQLIPLLCSEELKDFSPMFAVDKVDIDHELELQAKSRIGSYTLTSPRTTHLIATFSPLHFLTHGVRLKDAQMVAEGAKNVEFLRVSSKNQGTTSNAKAVDPLYTRSYRAPTKVQAPPRGEDTTSKISQMLGTGNPDTNGGLKGQDFKPLTPKEAASDIVSLLISWGVL